jgi:single-strand DNA-binding protein
MNKIMLTGHLGHTASVRDVDKRDHSGTMPVVNFSLAVREGWGEQERTIWYACAWWGERAAKAAQYLTKGGKVLVEGTPELRLFLKRDKSTGGEIAVTVRELEFLSSAGGTEKVENRESGKSENAEPVGAGAKPAGTENLDEDVPF